MSHQSPLSQWMETVSTMLPKLSRPQVKVLAYWSFGMVLAKSCGITLVCAALALKVEGAEQKGAWEPHWLKLLEKLEDRIPEHWTVIVMSDRGLYAPWLYAKIRSLGWHPFMRINKQGNFRPKGEGKFRSLSTAAPE